MLISKSPNDFDQEDAEFLDEMGLVVAFSSNAKQNAVNRIFGKSANLTRLSIGQCWAKMRGEQSARKILSWK